MRDGVARTESCSIHAGYKADVTEDYFSERRRCYLQTGHRDALTFIVEKIIAEAAMLAGYLRFPKDYKIRQALVGKASALIKGAGCVPLSCQIPFVREKYAALGLKPDTGIFVEIGAYDGESYSNTSFLADQGWRGVYVEPLPKYCRQARIRHVFNNVTIENVAIDDKVGTRTLFDMGSLSSLSPEMVSAYRKILWAKTSALGCKPRQVSTVTLEDILVRNEVPYSFDLLVVDVEGHEEPIIRSLLKTKWRPRTLIVELCDLHPDFVSSPELQFSHKRVRFSLLTHKYSQYYADHINSIFTLIHP
jgi:FkbM family methyltransferase